MEYLDFKKLIDALVARPKETEWIEFKHNFHSTLLGLIHVTGM